MKDGGTNKQIWLKRPARYPDSEYTYNVITENFRCDFYKCVDKTK